MRILVLCHRLPYPPNKGDKIRTFHEIRHLAQRHQIHLLTFSDPDESGNPEAELREFCAAVEVFPLRPLSSRLRCLKGLLGTRPLTTCYFGSTALARRVQQLATPDKCDVLVVCGSGMAAYAELATRVPRLLDMVDVDSEKWAQSARFSSGLRSMIWGLEVRRLAEYESGLNTAFDRVVLTTENEVSIFRSVCQGVPVGVVRNGVDLDVPVPAEQSRSPTPTLVFTGQMGYFANMDGVVHFSTQVFPNLKAKWRDLDFVIVGRSPTAEIKALEVIPGVIVTREVEDVGPFLAEAWVFVAPLRIAQGVQNKVLEAMAAGIPAVVSERVMAGLADGGFQDGRDLIAATDDKQFTRALNELLLDEGRRTELATNARLKLSDRYSWEANMLTLERILDEIKEPGPNSSASASRGEPIGLGAL